MDIADQNAGSANQRQESLRNDTPAPDVILATENGTDEKEVHQLDHSGTNNDREESDTEFTGSTQKEREKEASNAATESYMENVEETPLGLLEDKLSKIAFKDRARNDGRDTDREFNDRTEENYKKEADAESHKDYEENGCLDLGEDTLDMVRFKIRARDDGGDEEDNGTQEKHKKEVDDESHRDDVEEESADLLERKMNEVRFKADILTDEMESRQHPVDTGYAWVVMVVVFGLQFLLVGYIKALGVFFVEFQSRFGSSSSMTSVVIGVMELTGSLGSPLVMGVLMKVASPRTLCLIGCLFMTVGVAGNAWFTKVEYLCITQGVFYGSAIAFVYGPPFVSLTQYFDKRRALATSISTCGTSVGGIVFPLLCRFLLDEYAFGGGVLMTAGVLSQAFVFSALLIPIENYQRKKHVLIEVYVEDAPNDHNFITKFRGFFKSTSNKSTTGRQIREQPNHSGTCEDVDKIKFAGTATSIERGHDRQTTDVSSASVHIMSFSDAHNVPDGTLMNLIQKDIHENPQHDHYKECLPSQESTCSFLETKTREMDAEPKTIFKYQQQGLRSVADNGGDQNTSNSPQANAAESYRDTVDDENIVTDQAVAAGCSSNLQSENEFHESTSPSFFKQNCLKQFCFKCRQNVLVRSASFWILCVFFFCASIGTFLPQTYIPPLAKERGLSEDDGAFFLSVMNILDVPAHLLPGIIVNFRLLSPVSICIVPMFIVGLVGFLTPLFLNYGSFMAMSIIYGIFSGTYFVMQPLIVVETLGRDNFPTAMGLYMIFLGMGAAVSFPICGALRDSTGTYSSSFHYLGAVELVAVVMLLLIPLAKSYDVKKGVLPEET